MAHEFDYVPGVPETPEQKAARERHTAALRTQENLKRQAKGYVPVPAGMPDPKEPT